MAVGVTVVRTPGRLLNCRNGHLVLLAPVVRVSDAHAHET